MVDNIIMIDLDDSRSKDISEILGNKTCKKILGFLAEKEASENDIAQALKIPINTVEYNLNKLIKIGFIEKSKKFFWSVKGKKIETYKLSNKKVLISPKSSGITKGIIPAFLVVLLGSFGLKLISNRVSSDEVLSSSSLNYYSYVNGVAQSSSAARDSAVPVALSKSAEGVIGSANSIGGGAANYNMPSFSNISNFAYSILHEAWAYFLLGGLIAILIILIFNSFKNLKGGLK